MSERKRISPSLFWAAGFILNAYLHNSSTKEETTITDSKKHIADKPIINYDDYAGSNPISTAAIVMKEDNICPVFHDQENKLKELTDGYNEMV